MVRLRHSMSHDVLPAAVASWLRANAFPASLAGPLTSMPGVGGPSDLRRVTRRQLRVRGCTHARRVM